MLKKYQNSYKNNVTGELDNITVYMGTAPTIRKIYDLFIENYVTSDIEYIDEYPDSAELLALWIVNGKMYITPEIVLSGFVTDGNNLNRVDLF